MLDRHPILGVDLHGGVREALRRRRRAAWQAAAIDPGLGLAVTSRGARASQIRGMRFALVLDAHQRRRIARELEASRRRPARRAER